MFRWFLVFLCERWRGKCDPSLHSSYVSEIRTWRSESFSKPSSHLGWPQLSDHPCSFFFFFFSFLVYRLVDFNLFVYKIICSPCGFWCSSCLKLGLWEPPCCLRSSGCGPLGLGRLSCFLAQGEHAGPPDAVFGPDRESSISPRCPGFFHWGWLLRSRGLAAALFAAFRGDYCLQAFSVQT